MERIKKNFGFGFMRLPIRDGEVDIAEFRRYGSARTLYHFHVDNVSSY